MKTPILATGLSGLVGTRVQELLSDDYSFTDLSLETGVDIRNEDQVNKFMDKSEANVILHMAAKTDVDSCEDDKILGEEGKAWQINVIGTENIVSAARKTGKRIIYISTDFVFDGTKDFYDEKDTPNPISWYGITKYEGELVISSSGIDSTIIRISYPYRAYFEEKKDFVRKLLDQMQKKEKILALTDHIFTPTYIDDIAFCLDELFKRQILGIYHVVGSQSLKVIEAVKMIADKFNFKPDIEQITRSVFFKDRAYRPSYLALKNDKIRDLGVELRRFDEGLIDIKKQLQEEK